jgi:HK97 family phage major capsid protein
MSICPESAKANGAAFFCSSAFKDAVFSRLALTAGGVDTMSIQNGISRYGGYDIVVSPLMKADPAEDLTGLIPLLFGSMQRAALFGSRRDVEMEVDPSIYRNYRQIYLQCTSRFDIVPYDVGTATAAGQVVGLYGG